MPLSDESITLLVGYLAGVQLSNTTGSKVHLFKNDAEMTSEISLDDLTEADFDGYGAAGPIDNWLTGLDPEGDGKLIYVDSAVSYITTGETNLPQTIYGFYITADDDSLVYARKWTTPITLDEEGDVCQFVAQIPFRELWTTDV